MNGRACLSYARHSSRNAPRNGNSITPQEAAPETTGIQSASVSHNHAGSEAAAKWKKQRQFLRDSVGRKRAYVTYLFILIGYAVLMIAFGVILSRRVHKSGDFFVAGRELNAGLSAAQGRRRDLRKAEKIDRGQRL